MARIRSIKPEFWTNERVMECSPLARLLFIGLWNFCDDAGNHPDAERTLKALIFPGDDIDSATVRRLLDELSENGLLSLYAHEGRRYLHVNGWRHQKIEKPTVKYPPFTGVQQSNNESTGLAAQVVDEPSSNGRRVLDPGEEGERKGEDQDQEHVQTGQAGQDARAPEQVSSKVQGKAKPTSSKLDPLEGFDQFYRLYPRRQKRPDAEKAWRKLSPEQRQAAMAALPAHCQRPDWLKDGGQFVPLPASWLNGQRWEDELPTQNTHHPPSRFTGLDQIDHEAGLELQPDGTYRIARQRA